MATVKNSVGQEASAHVWLDDEHGLHVFIAADSIDDDDYPIIGLKELLLEFIDDNLGGPNYDMICASASSTLRSALSDVLRRLDELTPSTDERYFGAEPSRIDSPLTAHPTATAPAASPESTA